MAMNVPFPFRVAAGAIAVGIDRLRALPTELPAMSVTLAGHAVRASMRVQQELAQLAARGEEVLSTLTDRPEEHPAWAHFDDEDVVDGEVVEAADGSESGESAVAASPGAVGDGATGRNAGSGEDDGVRTGTTYPSDTASSPRVLSGYAELTVAQLRVRLRTLDGEAVAELLEHERAGLDRAAFVTTLHNRLTSLQSDGGATTPAAGARTDRKNQA